MSTQFNRPYGELARRTENETRTTLIQDFAAATGSEEKGRDALERISERIGERATWRDKDRVKIK